MRKQQILIVGGGFGGVKSALELAHNPKFNVTLVSNKPFFEYYPMMYHTATGGSRITSSIPLGEIFKDKRVNIVIDSAEKINRHNKTLKLKSGAKIEYDAIIIALGVVTNYFGIPGMEEYSYGIKSLHDAEELKAHLHEQLMSQRQPDSNYIIIGGGPTGIELAGAMTTYIKYLMKQHGIKSRKKIHIDLVEAAPRLVPRMPESVSRAIQKRLKKLDVKLYLNTPVQAETADALILDGKPIRSHTVIWTAGMSNNPFFKENKFQITDHGKVKVDALLQAWPGVFVIGDNADTKYSGMAQTAIHDANYVTKNIIRHSKGQAPLAYKPKRPVYVLPAGKGWAAVAWGGLHFYGRLGWILRKAGDWVGYRDVEPWWKATDRIFSDDIREDNCLVCATKVHAIE